MSAREEEEYKILKDCCQFDHDQDALVAKYAFAKDPSVLKDNGASALACQKKQEARQIKNGSHSKYVEQFQDMVSRKVVSPVLEEELNSYVGPVNYITHHEVYKESNTTPVRLVSNSSFPNGDTTFNDCLVQGPNTLADIYENLIKF